MIKVEIYTREYCFYCRRAKELLINKKILFEEISIDDNPKMYKSMIKRCNRTSVPQIFINGKHVGGSDDLYNLNDRGELDKIILSSYVVQTTE